MADSSFYKQNTLPDFAAQETEIPLPTSIGPYKIETLLSRGGMSLLYLGLDPETKKPLAIKVLSPSYVNHKEALDRFLQEAKVIELTNHPNIVKLYGQGEWEQGLYIAMELIRGISLNQFILQHSLSIRRALEITLQVAFALLHLHSHGVIHRDLKPENILITEEGEVKVIDFGIAQLHTEREIPLQTGRFLGTPTYMSPEQKEDPSSVTFASDIYSLGIILYELIVGKLSFGMIHLAELPKGLKKIATKSLAISSGERYQNISELIQDISQYLNSEELERERPGSDQVKELQERIQKASLALSPSLPPTWPQVELGIAKGRGPSQLGLYYDFFRLPNNTYLLLIAASTSPSIESAFAIASLRGMIQMHLHERQTPFKPIPFVTELNRLLSEDPSGEKLALNCLLLDPLRDLVTYLSCGLDALLHLSEGQTTARKLLAPNPLLGTPSAEFSEVTDNWNVGDLLFFHSLALSSTSRSEDKEALSTALSESIVENSLLSAQPQAEAILKRVSATPVSSPKILFTIQRIV